MRSRFPRAPIALALAALLIAATLGGCTSADSLGEEAPDRVAVGSPPAWNNGIGELFARKCAVCHQTPRPASSPSHTPGDLDLRFEKSAGAIRAAEDVAAPIALGVLRHGLTYSDGTHVVRTRSDVTMMPLEFATPLYEEEKIALETWAAGVLAAQTSALPALPSTRTPAELAADGESLYKRHCQGCHGVYGDGGSVRWPLRGYGFDAGPRFARSIQSIAPRYPMADWPAVAELAAHCTPSGTPTTCNGSGLDAIAAYLARF